MRAVKALVACAFAGALLCIAMAPAAPAALPQLVNSKGEKLEKKKFTNTFGSTALETKAGEKVTCKEGVETGEFTGESTATGTAKLTGCALNENSCETGAKAGEIVIKTSDTLVYTNRESHEVGFSTKPEETAIECVCPNMGQKIKIKGLAVSKSITVDELVTPPKAFSLKFSQTKGVQEPIKYENEKKETVEGFLEMNSSGLKTFSFEQTGLATTASLLLEEAAEVRTAPAPPATTCPIKSSDVSFRATVTAGNESTLREEVINDTRIPVGESGSCSEVVSYTTGVSKGQITTGQQEAYRAKIAELVVPGTYIYAFKWSPTGGGEEFETLGVTNGEVSVEFEPIGSWGPGESTSSGNFKEKPFEGPGGTYILTNEWELYTWFFGRRAFHVKQEMEIETPDNKSISRKVSTLSTENRIGWTTAAEKTDSEFENIESVLCFQVITKLTYASGFKNIEFEAAAEGKGWSVKVKIAGALGESGTEEKNKYVCANGVHLL